MLNKMVFDGLMNCFIGTFTRKSYVDWGSRELVHLLEAVFTLLESLVQSRFIYEFTLFI